MIIPFQTPIPFRFAIASVDASIIDWDVFNETQTTFNVRWRANAAGTPESGTGFQFVLEGVVLVATVEIAAALGTGKTFDQLTAQQLQRMVLKVAREKIEVQVQSLKTKLGA